MDYTSFIKAELLILIPVLYVLGMMLKGTEKIKDKYIPIILGGLSILLCVLYVVATEGFSPMSIFISITQGILITGVSVYVNQLIKQKTED